VALVVTFAIYYPWAKRTLRHPDRMIYPDDAAQAGMPRAASGAPQGGRRSVDDPDDSASELTR
jgi:hypothetical protein